ncbi:endonuclease/Exonuclease/phosphatase [Bisporella sp. PMI_857]|nr:endonuclease/Exonuclease/phosphatase [Bisporella sp. PMI_857]
MHFTLRVAAAALAFSTTALSAATSGIFNVISINVAGLPPWLNNNAVPGDKATNSRTIGSRLIGYGIVHMQEVLDFNYHAYIYETNTHPYRTATSGGVLFGSGLNTLSYYPWIHFRRIKWNSCNLNSGDCLTPKGFTFMRVQISEGVNVDFYNLHADAGNESGDQAARTSNFKQIADYIDTWSVGNAVVLYGDTNSRWTRAVVDGLGVFSTQNGMKDAWVELIRGGVTPTELTTCDNPSLTNYCEVVDKIFYRPSKVVNLQASYWSYDSTNFLQADGSILTDHNAIRADIQWSLSSTTRQSNYFGGDGGYWFNNIVALPSSPKTSVISVRAGERIDAIGVTLTNGQSSLHGGTGGTLRTLTLGSAEYWTKARLCKGVKNDRTSIFYILVTTSTGRTWSNGGSTSDCADFEAPSGWQIVGFAGQTGDEVDLLGLVYAPR